jgi:hypothetical protein
VPNVIEAAASRVLVSEAGDARSRLSPWTTAAILCVNLVSVFLLARYLFGKNDAGLFYGFDGGFDRGLIDHYAEFIGTLTGFASDLVRGLGNVVFPLNSEWLPSYLLAVSGSGTLDNPLSYAVGATELFAGMMLFGVIAGFRPAIVLTAAWLIFFTTWQIGGHPAIENLWRYMPPEAEVLTVDCLVGAALLRSGQGSLLQNIAVTVAIFCAVLIVSLAAPGDLLLCVPAWCAFAAATLLIQPRRREVAINLACALVLVAMVFATGLLPYLDGLFGYTAANVFPALSERPHTLWDGEVSLLLVEPITWGNLGDVLHQLLAPVRLLIGGGLVGAVYALFTGSVYVRRMACGLLLAETMYLMIGVVNYLHTFWFAPSISYFEMFLFPYFAFTLCYLALQPVGRALSLLIGRVPALYRAASLGSPILGGLIALLPWTVAADLGQAAQRAAPNNYPYATPRSEAETEITRLLRREIALSPGAPFRGRVATAIGKMLPAEKDWRLYSNLENLSVLATGNYHEGPGLWQDSIPTLMEYGAYKSPPYFVIMRRFFTAPDDLVVRNIVGIRNVDDRRMLRLLGVRFLLTDVPIEGAHEEARVPIAISQKTRERSAWARDLPDFNLYLYELARPNLGQYSPTTVRVVPSADAALTELADPQFDPAEIALTSTPLPAGLVPARFDALTLGKGEITVRAHSTATSLLVLPFEFSKCLSLRVQKVGESVRLVRIDLLLTGVLFAGDLDATLSYFTGPFSHSHCRLEDLADMRSLDISHAFAGEPAFGVLGQLMRK